MTATEAGDSTKHGAREGLSASLRRERCSFHSMLVSTFRIEDDRTPYVFSMPPHLDSEGDEVAACVSVRPFGKDSRDASINMSIDEAEELARQLVAVVTDARKGRFCEHGVQMAEDVREQDLREAWLVLGIEDLGDGE